MKILLISGQFPPTPGGGGVYTEYLMRALLSVKTPGGNTKNELRVMTSGNDRSYIEKILPNVEIHHVIFSRDGRVPYEAAVKQGLKLCQDFQPTVIHGQHFDGTYIAAQLKAAFPKTLALATFHQSPHGEKIGHLRQQDPKVAAMLALLPQMDKLVVSCPAYQKEAAGFGVSSSKMEMIWPGINPELIVGLATGRETFALELLGKLGIDPQAQRLILCPARIDPTKDLETFVRAAGTIKRKFAGKERFVFLIAGQSKNPSESEQRHQSQLEHIAESEGVKDDLRFTSFALQDMFAIYRLSSACVLPSVREALGLVLIEALALRTPLVVANVEGMSDVAEPERNALVFPPRDHDKLAEQLERLLFDQSLADRLRAEGTRTVEKKFAHTRMGQEHQTLYKRLKKSR